MLLSALIVFLCVLASLCGLVGVIGCCCLVVLDCGVLLLPVASSLVAVRCWSALAVACCLLLCVVVRCLMFVVSGKVC